MAASMERQTSSFDPTDNDPVGDLAIGSSYQLNELNSNHNESQKTDATQKLIKNLQFRNPGPLQVFDPNTSAREMRKVMRTSAAIGRAKNKKKMVYNEQGLLQESGRDLCDCLNHQCPGCHFPCPLCKSPKCGNECRCKRKWLYEQVEVEGIGVVYKFQRVTVMKQRRIASSWRTYSREVF
ncbi:ARL14 effector protein-like [Anneissia japonica]|uniref:ARL14 effector protein-like n=1 Tax=Anneissia japonica TaxID=1529436 RepID=UPI001425A6F0|nr:ARL14 effector protein-like [Anneissia japonica]